VSNELIVWHLGDVHEQQAGNRERRDFAFKFDSTIFSTLLLCVM
jgi:hypothetical protein